MYIWRHAWDTTLGPNIGNAVGRLANRSMVNLLGFGEWRDGAAICQVH